LLLILTACGSGAPATPTQVYRVISEVPAQSALPLPTGEIILTITGKIGRSNIPGTPKKVALDLAGLESLGMVEYKVLDKQGEGREAMFQGVLLQTLLMAVQTLPDATTLTFVARDDYHIDIPISDPQAYPILVATRIEGQPLALDQRGPARIIYPYGYFPFDEVQTDRR